MGFPGDLVSKESTCNAGDLISIPGLERSPGRGHGNSLQYSCLENPTDRGAWQDTVHWVTKTRMSNQAHTHTLDGKDGKKSGVPEANGRKFQEGGVAVRLSNVVLLGGGMMISLTASLYAVGQRVTWKQHGAWRTGPALVLRAA